MIIIIVLFLWLKHLSKNNIYSLASSAFLRLIDFQILRTSDSWQSNIELAAREKKTVSNYLMILKKMHLCAHYVPMAKIILFQIAADCSHTGLVINAISFCLLFQNWHIPESINAISITALLSVQFLKWPKYKARKELIEVKDKRVHFQGVIALLSRKINFEKKLTE